MNMNDDSYAPLIENNKPTTYKKYGAAIGVTGLTIAAALLLSGRSKAPVRPTDLIEMPEMTEQMIGSDITDMAANPAETCMSSFNRMRDMQGQSIDSEEFQNNLDANGKFEDPTFPADTSSLYWKFQENETSNRNQVITYQNNQNQYGIVWKRPSELPGTPNPSLWGSNGVSPKASKQGELGDCWFLSSASAVAGVPERIHRIFNNTEYSADGAFEMYFYVRGERVSVIIDDRIPVLDLGARYVTQYPPINSKPSPAGAWWLVLLEKAFSKLNINYTQINAGDPAEALKALTGMPVSTHDSNSVTDDELWDIIVEGTNAKNPMAAACTVSHYNLIAGHAYGILKGLCLTENGECVHKIVQMRNPWGLSKYTGPWSEDSDLWTPEWKQQANLADANEGEFWVALDQWRALYSSAYNTHYRDDWKVASIEGNPATYTAGTQQNGFISFEQPVEQDVVIDCVQYHSRLFPSGCDNEYTPLKFGFMIMTDQYQSMNTEPNMAMCNGGAIKLPNLAPGTYQVRVISFPGPNGDAGHDQIWNLRAFTAHSELKLDYARDPYSN